MPYAVPYNDVHDLLGVADRMARGVAKRQDARFADVLSDGAYGVVRAIRTYEPGRGATLESYARKVISDTIIDGIRQRDPVPRKLRAVLREADALEGELSLRENRHPSPLELERTLPKLRRARTYLAAAKPLSLDAQENGKLDLPDPSADPQTALARRERRASLQAALETLPKRQRDLIEAHYFRDVPFATVARELGVTPQRVSQLHAAALTKLRKKLGSRAFDECLSARRKP